MGKKRRKRRTSSCPEIALGVALAAAGICIEKYHPQELSIIFPYTKHLIAAGIFLGLLRFVITILFKNSKRARLLAATASEISKMDGVTFEECCIEHFRSLGYKASPTAASGDFGADIVLTKKGIKTVVQCKRYQGKVGVAAVQEVIGAKGYYKAQKAMVVTNSYYTPNAKALAKANEVELLDRDDMIKMFKVKAR